MSSQLSSKVFSNKPFLVLRGTEKVLRKTGSLETAFSNEEQRYYTTLPARKRDRYYVGSMLLKKTVARYLAGHGCRVSLADIEIKKDRLGKPSVRLPGTVPHVLISLSHAGSQYVAVAHGISIKHVGIDIEKIGSRFDRIVKSFLNDREQSFIAQKSVTARRAYLTLFWTVKEAYLKAIGTGLRVHPHTVLLTPKEVTLKKALFAVSSTKSGYTGIVVASVSKEGYAISVATVGTRMKRYGSH